jgi:hypothetical protein
MSVDGHVADAGVLPHVTLIDGNADQVRHDVGEAMIVVALDPDDFGAAARIGELANGGKELPVLALEPAEVQIGENVAEQNELAITSRLEQSEGVGSAAYFRPEVQVRKNERVKVRHHRSRIARCP